MNRRRTIVAVFGLAAGIASAALLPTHVHKPIVPLLRIGSTGPASRTATTTAVAPPPTYLDLIRADNPLIAATQPLESPVDLPDAAHVVLHAPVYLDSAAQLWITSPDAPSAEQLLARLGDEPQHVLRDRVRFVHWAADDNGVWSPTLIVDDAAGLALVGVHGRAPLALPHAAYQWSRAFSWQNRIVVPAERGAAVIDLQPLPLVHFHALPGLPQMVLDTRGLLAWVPPSPDDPPSAAPAVARFVDAAWTELPGVLPRPLQLVPLLDGSVLEIASAPASAPASTSPDDDTVRLAVLPLDTPGIDDRHVAALVQQLNDADPVRRQAAFDELSRYGPGVLPKLDALADTEPPETRLRLRQLLRGKASPALAGMELLDNRLSVLRRCVDGSTLLFASAGVRVPLADGSYDTVSPAWLWLHADGRFDRPLQANLVRDQNPAAATLSAYHDEWLLSDAAGVRRWNGVLFQPVVEQAEARFSQLIGIDRRGRWLFQCPADAGAGTLLIDPTLADSVPKLPAWAMTIVNGSVGWDDHDWPTIKRGGAWALQADHWEPLADGDIMHEAPALADTPPPATAPATRPLLVLADGTRYFGGNDAIQVERADGRAITWDLPTSAVGTSSTPVLLRGGDGRLFLFNQPGRCVCLQPTPGKPQPFTVAATFTRSIPNGEVQRIWLDPARRIDIVYQHNRLVVLFPSGHIPAEIQNMMGD